MTDLVVFMAAPFAACVVLVALHAYLGLHVLLRGIIFVDLALAQFAAFGTVLALIGGHPPGTGTSFAYSLAATFFGAAIFALTRLRRGRVPQESIIGITFVVVSAATLLAADRAPEGAEQIKELLAGAILWVDWTTVVKTLLVYLVVGLFHWFFRRRFIQISERPEQAYAEGVRIRWWDFLFYVSFGVVITLSVEIAGVLMVFSYLVAPAMIALVTSNRWAVRIALACSVGVLASALGLFSSYEWDLPSGPAIVCVLGGLLLLFGFARALRSANH